MFRCVTLILLLPFFVRSASLKPFSDSIFKLLHFSAADIKKRSAVLTLENGGESLFTRLWLFEHAKKSIDIQYYSFSRDITGTAACDYLIAAADRGVKVRILLDDAASTMYSHQIRLLDSHDNIEVKIYNAGLKLGKPFRRLRKFGHNLSRLQRRMHNKIVIIDGFAYITGGRNISNRYFDYDRRFNFRDRDVLLMGVSANQAQAAYEKFWNHNLVIPYSELSGKKKKPNERKYFDKLHASSLKEFPEDVRRKTNSFPEKIRHSQKNGELVWVEETFYVSDEPGNVKSKTSTACTDSLLELMRNAKKSIDIHSPYVILTKPLEDAIKHASSKGVRIRILTNSLSSIDNVVAFSGYQKDRKKILETGVKIYEFRPDAKVRYELMIPEVQAKLNYKPVYGFHSKTIIIDDHISVVGSYNFDPRSAIYNTECIVIIHSDEAAKNLSKFVEEEFLPENSWEISKDCNPDHKASLKKKCKAFWCKLIPKKLL